ncbi:hypothetical protein MTO96_050671 [Rhipicephalus appendiculatus]
MVPEQPTASESATTLLGSLAVRPARRDTSNEELVRRAAQRPCQGGDVGAVAAVFVQTTLTYRNRASGAASFLGQGVDDDCDDPWDDSGEQGRVDEDELRWLAERESDRDLERDFDRDLDRDLRRERELERLVCSCCCGWPRGGNDRS